MPSVDLTLDAWNHATDYPWAGAGEQRWHEARPTTTFDMSEGAAPPTGTPVFYTGFYRIYTIYLDLHGAPAGTPIHLVAHDWLDDTGAPWDWSPGWYGGPAEPPGTYALIDVTADNVGWEFIDDHGTSYGAAGATHFDAAGDIAADLSATTPGVVGGHLVRWLRVVWNQLIVVAGSTIDDPLGDPTQEQVPWPRFTMDYDAQPLMMIV